MTVEDLITWCFDNDIPLDTPVEPIHPALCAGVLYFRAGCNQTTCQRLKQATEYGKQLAGLLDISVDEIVKIGRADNLPDEHRNALRRLYNAYTKLGFRSIYRR